MNESVDPSFRFMRVDKDGIILDLLADEITAGSGRDPREHYGELEGRFGSPVYERIDAPASR